MLWNANILKMKQKCTLPTSGSAWHIQTPLQRTQPFFFAQVLNSQKNIILSHNLPSYLPVFFQALNT